MSSGNLDRVQNARAILRLVVPFSNITQVYQHALTLALSELQVPMSHGRLHKPPSRLVILGSSLLKCGSLSAGSLNTTQLVLRHVPVVEKRSGLRKYRNSHGHGCFNFVCDQEGRRPDISGFCDLVAILHTAQSRSLF
jgi:hypothetical protein